MAIPLPTHSTAFSDALVILGAAGLVIPAFARIRINPVIGFILVGIIAGPSGLGALVPEYPWLYHFTISDPRAITPFAEFGIVLLLFSIGLELSFRRLWAMRRLVFGLGTAELLLCALALGLAVHFSGAGWKASFGLGFALALSSTAIALPMTGTTGPVGQRAFSMLLFEDLALIPIIFTLGALAPIAPDGGETLLATALAGIVAITGLFVAGRLALPYLFAQAARTRNPEAFLAASLLVVILASVATSVAGLSPIVGALVAGLLLAETDYHAEVETMTAPFKGLALGVFLITVGMELDLRHIAQHWPALAGAIAGVVLLKTAITSALLRLDGSRPGVALETALLMAAPSETTLIVLGAALQARLISAETAQFWQIVTALGLTITPLLARIGRDVARRAELSRQEEPSLVPGTTKRTIIVGFGRVGQLVAQMLSTHDRPYLAIDADPDTVAEARRNGFAILFGDIARHGAFDRLAVADAAAVVLTMNDPGQLIRLTTAIRRAYHELTIIARARDPDHAAALYRAGATDAVPETVESSLQLSEAVLVDLGIAMGPVIASIHEKRSELRNRIMEMAQTDREPPLWRRRLPDGPNPPAQP